MKRVRPSAARQKAKNRGALELPWAGYRRQVEIQAAAFSPEELLESQRLARLLIAGELPNKCWPSIDIEEKQKLL